MRLNSYGKQIRQSFLPDLFVREFLDLCQDFSLNSSCSLYPNLYTMKKYGVSLFLVLMGLAFANVGVQALVNPEGIMGFVDVELNNPSARNSIRAYYGAVNLFFGLFLILGSWKLKKEALILVNLYCWGFVVGRVSSLALDGTPNDFVMNWLIIESVSGVIALLLLRANMLASGKLTSIELNH